MHGSFKLKAVGISVIPTTITLCTVFAENLIDLRQETLLKLNALWRGTETSEAKGLFCFVWGLSLFCLFVMLCMLCLFVF